MVLLQARFVTTSADDRLLRGIRVIRSLAGPPESPWPGRLAVMSDESRMLVDAGVVGDAWPGWGAAPEGHILAPLDVLRVEGGHVLVLPLCREPLADVIGRREATGASLTDGERLTITVSLLRGLAEVASMPGGRADGTWWVTDAARPVFAAGSGGGDAAEEAAQILRAVALRPGRLSTAIEAAADLAGLGPRLVREADSLEDELFALATPEPLALAVFTPRGARQPSVVRDAAPAEGDALDVPHSLWGGLVRHVDADLADLVSRVTTAAWRRLHASGGRRRRGPWVVAGVLGASIVAGAALLPQGADTPAVGVRESASPSPVAADEPAEAGPSAPTPESDDLAAVVSGILDARVTCGADAECLAPFMEDPTATVLPGVVDLPSTQRRVMVLDEFGGAAVLRVEAADGSREAQLVVVVRRDDRWLLRDVHDIAEQPS